jgi:UPF0716 protein FxsA
MAPILFLLFLVVPVLELWVILQVGRELGAGPTIVLLVIVSAVGAAIARREGLRAWYRFRAALAQGRIPAEEVVGGALVLLAGALLLTPGFLTDAVGLVLVLPLSRAIINRALRTRVLRAFGLAPARRSRRRRRRRSERGDEGVVDVEVMRVKRSGPDPDG